MEIDNDSTLFSLEKWFVHTFEKVGWIVLSYYKSTKNIAYIKKIDSYTTSVDKLLDDVNQRVQNPRGNNTITRDLTSMHKNLEHLKNYITHLADVEPYDSSENDLCIEDMSLQWMKHKYTHLFEKFGWMILLHSQLNDGHYSNKPKLEKAMQQKLENYSECVDILLQSINHRISTSNDIDIENLKHDLLVMHNNTKILNGFVKHLLNHKHVINKNVDDELLSENQNKDYMLIPQVKPQLFTITDKIDFSNNDGITSMSESSSMNA